MMFDPHLHHWYPCAMLHVLTLRLEGWFCPIQALASIEMQRSRQMR